MVPLPPFVARLIASDGYEEKKYFETKAAAEKWVLGEGKDNFDGDIERALIFHNQDGLIWSKDHPKVEDEWRIKQRRSDPNSLLRSYGWPQPKPKPDIFAHCDTCERDTMNWREYEDWHGIRLRNKPLLRCSECYKVVPENASQT